MCSDFFFVLNEKLCEAGVRFKTLPGCAIDSGCLQYNSVHIICGKHKIPIVVVLGIFHAIGYQNDQQRKLFAQS
jgi:hypothetical protein